MDSNNINKISLQIYNDNISKWFGLDPTKQKENNLLFFLLNKMNSEKPKTSLGTNLLLLNTETCSVI